MNDKIFMGSVNVSFFKTLAILIAILFLSLSSTAGAEEITYTGKAEALQNLPAWMGVNSPSIFPGTADTPLSSGNKVAINYKPSAAGTVNPEFVYGGISELKHTENNGVVLINGDVVKNIFGGFSVKGNTKGNSVTIDGGSVGGGVLCGFSALGEVADNIVTINGGAVKAGVLGGLGSGVVTGNAIAINGGTVDGEVTGGMGDRGDVSGNTITVRGGVIGSYVVGGANDKAGADGNTVIIDGGSVREYVYGGRSWDGGTTDNTVTINNGTISKDVIGGFSWNSISTGNTVTVSGGSVSGKVSGGSSHKGDVSGNTVNISGGSVSGNVYGGLSGDGHAQDNTVNISGSPDLLKADICGGFTSQSKDAFTGNTLNFQSSGISAIGVANFAYYNFSLPVNMKSGEAMLKVRDIVEFIGTTVDVSLQGKTDLKKGDKVALINSVKGIFDSPMNKTSKAQLGGVLYEFSIYTDNNNLWAEVTKISDAAK